MEVTSTGNRTQVVETKAVQKKQQVQEEQQKAAQREQAAPEQNQPKPVVNTQGQTTGRLLNTKA